MTAATPIPTAAESPLMDQPTEADHADSRPDPLTEAPPVGHTSPPTVAARATLRAQVAENPLASFLGAVVVALLVSMLATSNIRINRLEDKIERLEDKVDAGFAAQDAKIDAKFDDLDAKFGDLDAKFDEMNLKLTALIAKLNATDEADAAMEGRLIDRGDNPAAGP